MRPYFSSDLWSQDSIKVEDILSSIFFIKKIGKTTKKLKIIKDEPECIGRADFLIPIHVGLLNLHVWASFSLFFAVLFLG